MKQLAILLVVILFGCSKNDNSGGGTPSATVPTVTTTAATNITSTSAQSGGTITSDGGAPITARGVCWSVTTPTLLDPNTVDGSGTGSFSSSITNLFPFSIYSVRAYATNSAGTGYGNSITFLTPQQVSLPTVTTMAPANVKSASVSTGGEVTATGNATVIAKGICWSTSPNPTIASNTIPYGSGGLGVYSSFISGLTVHTTYYIRAYATNSVGTGYGQEYSFRTVYTIGEAYQGGRIFYLDPSNDHGLITALTDQSGGVKWNHTANPYAAISAYSTTNGSVNTTTIIAAIGSAGNAAGICRTYTGGGYNDWYLPSREELVLLNNQKAIIGNFQPGYYWSSTATADNSTAWYVDFGSLTAWYDFKIRLYFVRAIRSF